MSLKWLEIAELDNQKLGRRESENLGLNIWTLLTGYVSLGKLLSLCLGFFIYKKGIGAPGWLSRLSVRLQLRSWSCGPWVQALRRALRWQLRAWSLLRILCLPLSLPSSPPPPLMLVLSLALSLSKINKHLKIVFKYKKHLCTDSERTLRHLRVEKASCVYDVIGSYIYVKHTFV